MPKTKGKVIFDENYCKGCGLCVESCPVHCLSLDTSRITAKGYHPAVVVDEEACIACLNCAIMCPDSAITLQEAEN